jgi:hypothetical protein
MVFSQQVRTEPPRERGRNRLLEEDPDVPAPPRPRALESGIEVEPSTRLQKRRRIVLPFRLIEVGGEEVTGLVEKQWIGAGHERLAVLVLA